MDTSFLVYLACVLAWGALIFGGGFYWGRRSAGQGWAVTPWVSAERFEEFCSRPEVEEPPPWSVERLRREMEQ